MTSTLHIVRRGVLKEEWARKRMKSLCLMKIHMSQNAFGGKAENIIHSELLSVCVLSQ